MSSVDQQVSSSSVTPPANAKQIQQIVDGLNKMRGEQRNLTQKVVELEADQNEHRLVIEALKSTNSDRKCFRMIGGVLVEQTVKEVLPDLEKNLEMLTQTVGSFQEKVKAKGIEINEYIKQHNLGPLIRPSVGVPQTLKA